jgi:hypothetical protein
MEKKFRVGPFAMFFFDRSVPWIRTMEKSGIANGLGERTGSRGDREYTVDDAVTLADRLREKGLIDDKNYRLIVRRVEDQRKRLSTKSLSRTTG